MKVVKSSLDKVQYDLMKNLSQNYDTVFGYLVADQIAIWDPVWINPDAEELPPIRFNENIVNALHIKTVQMPLAGGTIVNNIGDIGLFVMSKDIHSKWEVAAMQEIVRYLKLRYGLNAEIDGNDVLLNGEKFIGTSIGFSTFYRYAAMFISMNDTTNNLIKLICRKPSKHKGFVGLSRYNVCPRKLITRMLRFTRDWERRAL